MPNEIDIKRLPRSPKPDDEWDAYRNDELDELPPTVLMVHNVQANGGWGPLLYELAMEMASYDGGGLIADRERTDSLAMPVWKAFFNRSDIEKHELPDTFTPTKAASSPKRIWQFSTTASSNSPTPASKP